MNYPHHAFWSLAIQVIGMHNFKTEGQQQSECYCLIIIFASHPKMEIDTLSMIAGFMKAPLVSARVCMQVFGKTLLCKDLDVANAAAHRIHLNGITMAGDQVNKKGSFTGGFRDASK